MSYPLHSSFISAEFWHFFHLEHTVYYRKEPMIVIPSPDIMTSLSAPVEQSSCYPLRKDKGQISWSGTKSIALKAFSYQHVIPKTRNPFNFNLTYSSAPSEMVLYGYKDFTAYALGLFGGGKGKIKLATMNFDMTTENDEANYNFWQYNSETEILTSLNTVQIESEEKYEYFTIEINGNHGFKQYTCLYRFYFWE